MTALQSNLLRDLRSRGLLAQCTDLAGLDALLASGSRVAVYAGFDATADSLHVGHLVALTALRRFAEAGHEIIPLCGTSTAKIGDPSGRNSARPPLSDEQLAANVNGIRRSMAAVLGADAVVHANDWHEETNVVAFFRDTLGAIQLSHLLALESVKARLGHDAHPITVMEALYAMLQAADFLRLARDCRSRGLPLVQIGGSDQWGNICMGLELIGKREPGLKSFGLTLPLLTKADGTKMGKTVSGAVWLNPDRLPDTAFFQFWRDVEDARVAALAKTFLATRSPHEIDALDLGDAAVANALKEELAFAVTALVRGEAAAAAALASARAVFGAGGIDGLPVFETTKAELADLPAVMLRAGLAESKGAARRLIQGNAVRLGDRRLTLGDLPLTDVPVGLIGLTAGRKNRIALRVSE